jgi:excisionase family DNA binding protein
MNPKLTAERLARRAVVYVRQSTPGQVLHNLESQRRQYNLVDRAREVGFSDVLVIDEDLGRTGSGLEERRGFQRLVAEACTGAVGAIFCIEASRLARNGRDWHHLIELCGRVGAVVVDPDGVYDPTIINDRLLLGLKGTMSEFELNLIRQRSLEAIRQKARRGELRFRLPVGFCWSSSGKIEIHPDRRVQQAIQLVFTKMIELGSVRRVLLWFRQEKLSVPTWPCEAGEPRTVWKLPVYHSIHAILTNPIYAGAYAFGKTEVRTQVVNDRARKTQGYRKPRSAWMVLICDHHSGYIPWEQYERNQAMLAANTHMKSGMHPKAGRGGRALLSGLLRCRRCGRMVHVDYVGRAAVPRYQCDDAYRDYGERLCISFGSLRVDKAVAKKVLETISGNAVEAALQAAEQLRQQRQEQRRAMELALEEARYEAQLAARRYEAVDPTNRLVAGELESRWNIALEKARELEDKLQEFAAGMNSVSLPDREVLMSLAQDLPAVWNSPTSDMRVKQRIVRILIREIVVDVDEKSTEIVLLIHWAGGRHSELRVKKNQTGKHRWCTSVEAIKVLRQMAGNYTDEQIATTLNRLGLRTGVGNTWNATRVYSARQSYQLAAFDPNRQPSGQVTLEQAAEHLSISPTTVRRMIEQNKLPASQVVACAPWQIPIEALDSDLVREAVKDIRDRIHVPQTRSVDEQQTMFPET